MARIPARTVGRKTDRATPSRPRATPERDVESETWALQSAAGNQAVASLLGRDGSTEAAAPPAARPGDRTIARLFDAAVMQRHEGPTANEEVGGGTDVAAPVEGAAPATTTDTATTQPGTGTTGTSGTTSKPLTGDKRRKAIEDVLRASATGMWALDIIAKWKVPVDYDYGGVGSFHQGGNVYINKSLGIGAAAITMMHEAQHAKTYKSGAQADIVKLGRAEYVKKSIADEAEATVRQIEGLAVTTGLGVDMTGVSIDAGLKKRYLTAFYAKRDELRKSNPEMNTAQINAICRTATRDGEVTNWFWDGTFVVSVEKTPTSYPDFYGKQWDDEHKPPAKT